MMLLPFAGSLALFSKFNKITGEKYLNKCQDYHLFGFQEDFSEQIFT